MKQLLQTLALILIGMPLVGCQSESAPQASDRTSEVPSELKPLAAADTVILYSIDGNYYEKGKEPKANELFGSYPVLGKLELDKQARVEILASIETALNNNPPAKCFTPRHVLRALKGKTTVDYIICFQCNATHVVANGETTGLHISRDAQAALDKHLNMANIPLAPQ